jgi:hypothetical protein
VAGATLPELPVLAAVLGGTRMIVPDPPEFTVDCAWAEKEAAHVVARIRNTLVIGLISGTPHNDYVKRKWGPVGSLQAEKRRHKAAFLNQRTRQIVKVARATRTAQRSASKPGFVAGGHCCSPDCSGNFDRFILADF